MDTEELIRQKAVEKLAGMEKIIDILKPHKYPMLSYAAAGATGGAITGAMHQLTRPKEDRNYLGGAITGAIGGGMMGAGLNYGLNKLNKFLDPEGYPANYASLTLNELLHSGSLGGIAGSFTSHLAPTPKKIDQAKLEEALQLEAFLNTPEADNYYTPQDKQSLLQYIEQVKQGA